MRRFLVLFLASGLIITSFCVITFTQSPIHVSADDPAPPYEVWVDDNFNASTPGWGVDHFDKIQDGIDNVSTPGIVNVASAIYYENLVLKDGVELLGAGSASTIIDGMQNGSVVTANNVGNTTKLEGFTITNGNASNGGGIFNSFSSPVITNCSIQHNSAWSGGGIDNLMSSPVITNCIFWNNSAEHGGGIHNIDLEWWNPSTSPVITNCVFWNNSAEANGGGILNNDSLTIITNSILWKNSPNEITGNTLTFSHSDVQGGYSGEGNIDTDPMFVNASAGDFHLSSGSPCIDTGNNSALFLPAIDFEGDRRILPVWGTVDMGVDEYIHAAPSCDSWDIEYNIVGGQMTMNYSVAGMTPVRKVFPFAQGQGGMTFRFCKTDTNGCHLVVAPQDSWQMETFTIEDIMTGIDMDLTIDLDADSTGILYIAGDIGDVDIISESVSGRTPVQINTIGDSTLDPAGSMLLPLTLSGEFDTTAGESFEMPLDMVFTTGNTSNIVSIPTNQKMDGDIMASVGVSFTEGGGVAPYVGTNGTITATGTGDCLGIRLVGMRVDCQFELKLQLEPVRSGDINYDGHVNVQDIQLVCGHWAQTGSPGWIPEDVRFDGIINVQDIQIICGHWTG